MEILKYVTRLDYEEQAQLEKERAKIQIFAANPMLYKELFETTVEEPNIDWITPTSIDDAEAWLNYLDSLHTGSG